MKDKTYMLSGHHLDNLISYYSHFDDFASFKNDIGAEGLYDKQIVERIVDFHKKLVDNPNTKEQTFQSGEN